MKTILLSTVLILAVACIACEKSKPDSCIDRTLIDLSAPIVTDATKVCGCDNNTYENGHEATVRHGVTSYTMGACEVTSVDDCIDSSLIDWYPDMPQPTDGTNVCGCDGKTYYNGFLAEHKYGVVKYSLGPCKE